MARPSEGVGYRIMLAEQRGGVGEILAYARGSAEEREFWKQAITGHRTSDEDLAYATSLLHKHETIADTLARARHYGQRAVDAIGGFRASQAKSALTEAVAFAVSRAY